jgi:BlaI family penicillinase repressor
MGEQPELSKAELEVARIVWRLGGGGVRDVLENLPADRDIDFKTVQTYLRRLEAKGYLASKREGRSLIYRPRVRATTVTRQLVNDFLDRLFDGEALPLVQCLIQQKGLSAHEIRQLREMLDQQERDAS